MRSSWKRLGMAVGMLAVVGSGIWTLAGVIPPEDVFPCKKARRHCGTKCEDSTYNGVGLCREGTDGPTSAISIECCCCTSGFQNRYFIGG